MDKFRVMLKNQLVKEPRSPWNELALRHSRQNAS